MPDPNRRLDGRCYLCGDPIPTGDYCANCADKITHTPELTVRELLELRRQHLARIARSLSRR